MRISDWSSDVCSSDLEAGASQCRCGLTGAERARAEPADCRANRPGRAIGAVAFDCSKVDKVDGSTGGAAVKGEEKVRPRRALAIGAGVACGESARGTRSEEHTSELQSLMRNSYAVLCMTTETTRI